LYFVANKQKILETTLPMILNNFAARKKIEKFTMENISRKSGQGLGLSFGIFTFCFP